MDFDSGRFDFKPGDPPVAIAEAGVNHNASMDLAKKLILEAKKAGAHVVKFQAFVSEEEISKYADKAEYQKETTGAGGGQLEMAKALELSHDQLRTLREFCFREKMPFLCTAFESLSLRFLVTDLGVKSVKVASSEVTNHPFLAEIAKTGVGVLLSTGASTLDEVGAAVRVLAAAGAKDVLLMHCVSNYPADMDQINLSAMETMRRAFKLPVGYSDHTMGVEAPIAAAALGAACVEKHFTLDRSMPGPDHRASIEPAELAAMVRGMRAAHGARGNGIKAPVPCELANRALIRKSIVARRDLPAGHRIAEADLAFKRPVNGIEPFDLDKVLGKILTRALSADEPLTWDILG